MRNVVFFIYEGFGMAKVQNAKVQSGRGDPWADGACGTGISCLSNTETADFDDKPVSAGSRDNGRGGGGGGEGATTQAMRSKGAERNLFFL